MFIPEREPRAAEATSPLESRTRSRVLHMVSADGPITAAELGRHLDLTPAAVRRHLDALVELGVIIEHEPTATRRGRGRPARAYVISDAGHETLEADYDELAVDVLRYLAETGGPGAVAAFARRRTETLEQRYAASLAHVGPDPEARAEVLVEALSADGYAASARPVAAGGLTGVQLCQGHCPVRHAAAQFPEFCEAETDAFSRLLGVHVQRLATLAGGDHVCTTFIPTGGLTRKPPAPSGVGPDEPLPTTAPNPTTVLTHAPTVHTKEGSSS